MPFRCEWLIPKRLIYNVVFDTLTLDEMLEIERRWLALLAETDEPASTSTVHGIWELSQLTEMPTPFDIRKNLRFPEHPKIGWGVFVGIKDPMIRFVLSIAPQLFRVRFRHFSSFEDGIAFLQDIDRTLPDIQPYLAALKNHPTP